MIGNSRWSVLVTIYTAISDIRRDDKICVLKGYMKSIRALISLPCRRQQTLNHNWRMCIKGLCFCFSFHWAGIGVIFMKTNLISKEVQMSVDRNDDRISQGSPTQNDASVNIFVQTHMVFPEWQGMCASSI